MADTTILYTIAQGTIVHDNKDYEVVEAGEYTLLDFVPCRPIIGSNRVKCAFLAASVLGIDINTNENTE